LRSGMAQKNNSRRRRSALAAVDLAGGPADGFIGLDRIGDCLKLALFVGALGTAREIIGTFH